MNYTLYISFLSSEKTSKVYTDTMTIHQVSTKQCRLCTCHCVCVCVCVCIHVHVHVVHVYTQ